MIPSRYQPMAAILRIDQAFDRASDEMKSALAEAGVQFPHKAVAAALENPTYEALEAAISGIKKVMTGNCEQTLQRIEDLTGTDFDAELERIGFCEPLRVNILPQFVGSAELGLRSIPHFCPANPGEGEHVFHSLGEAAWERNAREGRAAVPVTVFDRTLQAEVLYDSRKWLEEGVREPVGVTSSYKVTMHEGELIHPPAWPSDLARTIEAGVEDEEMSL